MENPGTYMFGSNLSKYNRLKLTLSIHIHIFKLTSPKWLPRIYWKRAPKAQTARK